MNITTHELRRQLTGIEILVKHDMIMASRYEYPYKLCLRLPVNDLSTKPKYIFENVSRKELLGLMKELKTYLKSLPFEERERYLVSVSK